MSEFENTEGDVVLVRYEEEDDHGHSTLVFHGEPEPIAAIMAASLLVLASLSDVIDGIPAPEGEEIEGLGDEPSLAESA